MPCMAENRPEEVSAVKKAACVGILVADIIVEPVSKYPEKGLLMPVNSITLHNGGNAMTAAVNLKKLGVDTAIIGKVGADMFGKYLKARLSDTGVDTRGLSIDAKVQTSASVLMLDKTGERSFFHCVGANGAFSLSDIDFSVLEDYELVFVTGSFLMDTFDGTETMEFLKRCKQLGKTTFLDVCWDASGRWGGLLDMSMPYIDFLMPSIDEAIKLAGAENPEEICSVLAARGAKNIVIKMGGSGCYLKTAQMQKGILLPSHRVEAVDTTGAGDSFCSGFIAAYARSESPEECARIANAAGAGCVMKTGATTWAESYEKLLDFAREE